MAGAVHAFTTAVELRAAIAAGAMSAREACELALARIDLGDAHLHAFKHVDRERALARADALDRSAPSGPLHGVPVAIKDNISVRGMKTTAGSRILEGYVPPFDATAVARLEDAGAVILGKTVLDEFGMGSSTENS